MKTYLDCIPCFVQQALRAGRAATEDEAELKLLLDRIGSRIRDIPLDHTPPEMGLIIYDEIAKITGNSDPYRSHKARHITEAKRLLPSLRQAVRRSCDPLETALRIAIAGNVIDLGMDKEFHIEKDMQLILRQEFAIYDADAFRQVLSRTKEVLYLGDNAGESVFDRVLIEALRKPVTYVVRAQPIINDVTEEDARASGLQEVAEILSSGSPAPATLLSYCTPEFIARFESAQMIISKGQGNYEGLSGTDRPVFFLLKAKCPLIARDLGVEENAIVMKYAGNKGE
ncbi:MAG: ARMT1-like domain-containing protein [Candidatus Neomarinimicrobiota bacterium]|jgi:hypothetical protein|nr:ARMT1-like domain-containing protein [Candidatus Neomarinimicrobiota bacterium]MDD3966712.1 ARMT1-like domain-containing protein [Candidatus Neomarinimicrobiota bacterium]MDX9779689.1 ARMT1-like domain-containing protein [bacterium]